MSEKRLTRNLAHGLTTACCGDVRLHGILPLLDDNESYRERSIGAPLKFAIDQGDLLKWHAILTGFPEDGIPVSDALLLAHTDCLAVNTNAYFATLKEKRNRFAATLEGDFEFCAQQLGRIRQHTARLKGVYPIHWHFGTIDTEQAEKLGPSATLENALNCIRWPFGMPKFFQERLRMETAVNGHGTAPVVPLHHGPAVRHHSGAHHQTAAAVNGS